jgi:hypothetical protein
LIWSDQLARVNFSLQENAYLNFCRRGRIVWPNWAGYGRKRYVQKSMNSRDVRVNAVLHFTVHVRAVDESESGILRQRSFYLESVASDLEYIRAWQLFW